MLTQFPLPYPEEWWYSVLCRYHIRTGNLKHQTTVHELFQGANAAAMGSLFPNRTLSDVFTQLPKGVLNFDELLQDQTLLPYFVRFHQTERKKEIAENVRLGRAMVVSSIWRVDSKRKWKPRYCPVCYQEDQERYGEPYWHTPHQIPGITHCHQHGCRLVAVEQIIPAHMSYTFYPLCAFKLSAQEIEVEGWPLALSRILYDYWKLPLLIGPTDGYSNLAIRLGNMGYEVIQKKSRHTILDVKRLYRDLSAYYGAQLVSEIVGTDPTVCRINRACKWQGIAPDLYALLQCFAGTSTETVFSAERLSSKFELQLRQLEAEPVVYTKKQILERLDVTASQLEILAKKFGMEPFWRRSQHEDSVPKRKYQFVMEGDQLAQFEQAFAQSGFRYESYFIRYCIQFYLEAKIWTTDTQDVPQMKADRTLPGKSGS